MKNKTLKLIIVIIHWLCFIVGLHLHQCNHCFNGICGCESTRKCQKVLSKIKTWDLWVTI